nr:MAG TPA: hypothetical protein [Caudoviricetes sp.]
MKHRRVGNSLPTKSQCSLKTPNCNHRRIIRCLHHPIIKSPKPPRRPAAH